MPRIPPVDLTASEKAKADIEWLASAMGFVANSMLSLSHRPELANAVLGLIRSGEFRNILQTSGKDISN